MTKTKSIFITSLDEGYVVNTDNKTKAIPTADKVDELIKDAVISISGFRSLNTKNIKHLYIC